MAESVLLLGNYRTTLTAIESVVGGGYRVVLGVSGYTQGTERALGVRETWPHPEVDAPGFGEALVGFLERRPDIRAVLPVTEEAMLATAPLRSRLPDHAALASPAAEIIALAQDKGRSLDLVTELGVPARPYAVVGPAEYEAKCRELGTPLVIRPVVAPGRVYGRKAWIARSDEELPPWPEEHARLLLQQYAEGLRHCLDFAAADGELLGLVEYKTLRTDRWDGTGLGVDGITIAADEDRVGWVRAVARRLNYSGVGSLQMLVNSAPGGSSPPCFLELNPRLGGNVRVAVAAGGQLPRYAVDIALGRRPSVPARYTEGVRFSWLYGDLAGLMHDPLAPRERLRWLRRTARTLLRADVDLVHSRDNPGPALDLYTGKLRALLRRGSR